MLALAVPGIQEMGPITRAANFMKQNVFRNCLSVPKIKGGGARAQMFLDIHVQSVSSKHGQK